MYQIDKNVPIPKANSGSKYPVADMQVGDSFLIPFPSKDSVLENRARSAVKAAALRAKVTIATHLVEGGIRVWRIA